MSIKDDDGFAFPAPSNVRQGRFMWLSPPEREDYIQRIREKINQGYYFSDQVVSSVVDGLAPVIEDVTFGEKGALASW